MALCNSNVTSGFIDLATYDEQEKFLYGGQEAIAYFVRDTVKATWFTQVPVCLATNQTANWNSDWSAQISRAGDYMLTAWLRVQLPSLTLAGVAGTTVSWTPNFMHNLIAECTLTFNDLVAARFDSNHLDFWAAFSVPAGKQVGYDNMIGNTANLTTPVPANGGVLPGATLNLPLPFFFARDSGVALPTAALPYNEMRINFCMRDPLALLTVWTPAAGGVRATCAAATNTNLGINPMPALPCNVWANYAIVSNDERKRMACAPRDILIEQAQLAPPQIVAPATNNAPAIDIRFSHAVKVLFFAMRNMTCPTFFSNYQVMSPQPAVGGGWILAAGVWPQGLDPLATAGLTYENTTRLSGMGVDYYSLVQPWYHAPVIPTVTGYHMYSYSLDFIALDPLGSTNYGKLTNVTVNPVSGNAAINANGGVGVPATVAGPLPNGVQTYRFVCTCVNNNIIRISGGALGFPVL